MGLLKHKRTYEFKKGTIIELDALHGIKHLCGGFWWEPVENIDRPNHDGHHHPLSDLCRITRDITIELLSRQSKE